MEGTRHRPMWHFAQNILKRVDPRKDFCWRYEHQEDDYGFDLDSFLTYEPIFRFFYEEFFKVQTIGIENIPDEGRTLIVGNHSGVLPVDAWMLYCANYNLHPHPRRIRFLVVDYLLSPPLTGHVFRSSGGVPASHEVARELLENDEIVCIYPEGTRGTGKPFSQRYRLCDFHPGFVKEAIETNSPIVPVTTVGGDEIYPLLARMEKVARVMGAPYWPVTPIFPWLPFPTSAIPLPVRMLIKVGKPIYLNYSPEQARDKKLRMRIARDIQYEIQRELNFLLRNRKSLFAEWDIDKVRCNPESFGLLSDHIIAPAS